MGDIVDMMLDGTLCECCGEYMGGQGAGIRQYCSNACASDRGADYHEPIFDDDGLEKNAFTRDGKPVHRPTKINCPECNKLVKKKGLDMHMLNVHKEKNHANIPQ